MHLLIILYLKVNYYINEDIHKLMDMGIEFNKDSENKKLLLELMINVRDNHTYINRIKSIIKFLEIKELIK